MINRIIQSVLMALLLSGSAAAAVVQGDYLGTFSGNDSEAAMLAAIGVEVTELARVEAPGTSDGGLTISELVLNDDGEPISGQWEYAGPGLVDYLVIKAGNLFAVYHYTDANTSNMRNIGLWDTSDLNNKGMSHITAYQAVVPVPGAIWLLGTGLLALVRRRR